MKSDKSATPRADDEGQKNKQYYSLKEFASRLGTTEKIISVHVRMRQIPCERQGRRVWIRGETLDRILNHDWAARRSNGESIRSIIESISFGE